MVTSVHVLDDRSSDSTDKDAARDEKSDISMWQAGLRFLGDWVCRAIRFVARKVNSYQSCSSRLQHGRDLNEDVKDEAKDAKTDDTQRNLCWTRVAGVVIVMNDNRHCVVGRRWGVGSGQNRLVCCRVWCMGAVTGMLRVLLSWVSGYAVDTVVDGILCNRHLPPHPLLCSFFLCAASRRRPRV